jgi:hypothetical protein
MENNNWWGETYLGENFEKDFEVYLKEKVEKRADDADFFLDILIDQGIIKLNKEKVREYFVKWFIENKNFDLQIENGDLAMEDEDLKFVPNFDKHDIIGFIRWFESEKNEFIDYLKKNGVKIDNEKNISVTNSGNLIINNNSNINQQSNLSSDKKKKWEKGTTISLLSLIIAFTVLIFGNNLIDRISNKTEKKEYYNKEVPTVSLVNTIDLPYLENVPILDKGLFIKYYYNNLIIGGANLDEIKINARAENGDKLEINNEVFNNNLEVDITKEPYIEIEYKNVFYSIEITGKHYNFRCKISKLKNPTLIL